MAGLRATGSAWACRAPSAWSMISTSSPHPEPARASPSRAGADMPRTSLEVEVRDVSQVGDARRKVLRLAQLAGMDEAAAGNAAIVATEMATNLVNHAGGGVVLARS